MKVIRRSEQRARAAARAGLPDLIELVIIGVRAGLTPAAAIEMAAAHTAPELAGPLDVTHQMHRGRRLSDALGALPNWLGNTPPISPTRRSRPDRYGHPLGPVLDQLSADVRADRSRLAQQQARTLPVKLSFPLVVCTLPSFVLLAIAPAVLGAVSTITGTAP